MFTAQGGPLRPFDAFFTSLSIASAFTFTHSVQVAQKNVLVRSSDMDNNSCPTRLLCLLCFLWTPVVQSGCNERSVSPSYTRFPVRSAGVFVLSLQRRSESDRRSGNRSCCWDFPTLHVCHIYLHWGGLGGQCRHIWHTWSVWDIHNACT